MNQLMKKMKSSILRVIEKFRLVRCFNGGHRLPRFMFTSLPKGWYSRTGHNYDCKFCRFRDDTRYMRVKKEGAAFATLELVKVDWKYRLKEVFR